MTVRLQRPAPYLEFELGGLVHRVDVITKDIGCTIGTELRYVGPIPGLGSLRLVAYRPGTRYSDRAEECAAEHLTKALERFRASAGWLDMAGITRLAECLRDVVTEGGCRLWDPEHEEDEWQ